MSLAAVTGEAVEVRNVRGARSTPGIRPQHRAAVDAVAACCDAAVTGNEVGSERLRFDPGPVTGGDVTIDVGTAGSVALVFDAVLPLATRLDAPLSVTATGGTAVEWAPTLAYLRRVKVDLLARFGLDATVTCDRPGFFPAGGGRATLVVRPSALRPLEVTDRGGLDAVTVQSVAASALADRDVAGRQATAARDALRAAGTPADAVRADHRAADCPGSVVLVRGAYDGSLAGFSALGARGKPAEDVGREAADAFGAFHAGPGAVDQYMADQLVVWVALAGGAYTAPAVTDHVRTNRETVSAFGVDVSVDGEAPVRIEGPAPGTRS